jgi:hypothetical protein
MTIKVWNTTNLQTDVKLNLKALLEDEDTEENEFVLVDQSDDEEGEDEESELMIVGHSIDFTDCTYSLAFCDNSDTLYIAVGDEDFSIKAWQLRDTWA